MNDAEDTSGDHERRLVRANVISISHGATDAIPEIPSRQMFLQVCDAIETIQRRRRNITALSIGVSAGPPVLVFLTAEKFSVVAGIIGAVIGYTIGRSVGLLVTREDLGALKEVVQRYYNHYPTMETDMILHEHKIWIPNYVPPPIGIIERER